MLNVIEFHFQLYKGAGEDVIQLFDLSVLPKKHSDDGHDKSCSSLSSLMSKGRRDSLFSLGKLLYRVAHRLSLSKVTELEFFSLFFFLLIFPPKQFIYLAFFRHLITK